MVVPNLQSVPLVGPWQAKIGRVVRITASPCSPSPVIVAYAAFSALPTLIISLFKPDPVDARYSNFGRPHRRGWRWRVRASDVLYPLNPVGGPDGSAMWNLGQWAQRIGWYFMIVDATLDFVVNWTSMVYAWSGCPAPGGVYLMQTNAGRVYGEDLGWQPMGTWAHVQGNQILSVNTGCIVPAKTNAEASLNAVGQPFPLPTSAPCTYDTRIVHVLSGYVLAQGSSRLSTTGNQVAAISGGFANPFDAPTYLEYQIKANNDGACNFDGSTAQAWGWNAIGVKPDP